ncbi:MAG: glycosyltransferase [Sumerlaeia bacterium]
MNSNNPPFLLSIIMASYNHEAYIDEAIASVVEQSDPHWELIIVDDGSQDQTAAKALAWAQKHPQIKFLPQQNKGVTSARNRALDHCSGTHVSQLDSDDTYPSNRVKIVRNAVEKTPEAVLIYGDAWLIDREGNKVDRFFNLYTPKYEPSFSAALFAHYCFTHAQSVTVRRNALNRTGPFWGPSHNIDYLKWIEVGLLGEVVEISAPPLSNHRIHGANASTPTAEKRAKQYHETAEGLRSLLRRCPKLRRLTTPKQQAKRIAQCYFMGGFHALRLSKPALARQQLRKAFRENPSILNAAAIFATLPIVSILTAKLAEFIAVKKLGIYR